jgi:prophage antirepressor-like protein
MEKKRMSNPIEFCKEAKKLNIRYEYLIEAKECIGGQNLARMFIGKSLRGGGDSVSAATIETWINTFEYVKEHPTEEDNDQYTARKLEPKQEYYDYIKIITQVIPTDIVGKWKTISNKALGDEAQKYGITLGIRNANAVKTLHKRMEDMVERRKKNIWNNNEDEEISNEPKEENINYRMTNVPELRRLCKERNLSNAHIKTKEGLIQLLERNPNILVQQEINESNYNKMTTRELKKLAKEKGFTRYNNLNKSDLVKLFEDNDTEENDAEDNDREESSILNIEIEKSKLDIKENIDEIDSNTLTKVENNILNETFVFNNNEIRTIGSYEEPYFVMKDIANILDLANYRNVYSKMEDYMKGVQLLDTPGGKQDMQVINESGLYYMIIKSTKQIAKEFQKWVFKDILPTIRKKGTYTLEKQNKFILQRPIKPLLLLSELDIEAEELEMNFNIYDYTNKCVLYLAYIGNGLVKLGFSDCRIIKREGKHTSCESEYEQFRMIKIFEVSSQIIENTIKKLLQEYKAPFNKQQEVFKPPSTLKNFIEIIDKLLKDNDLKLQLELARMEILELKNKTNELIIENLKLKNECLS